MPKAAPAAAASEREAEESQNPEQATAKQKNKRVKNSSTPLKKKKPAAFNVNAVAAALQNSIAKLKRPSSDRPDIRSLFPDGLDLRSNIEAVENSIILPEDAQAKIRDAIGLNQNAPLRISYIPGPGDLSGTYALWKQGQHETAIPSIAYSTMFFELCKQIDANAQIIERDEISADTKQDDRFRFDKLSYKRGSSRFAYWSQRAKYARDCIKAIKDFDPHIVIISSDYPFYALKPLVKKNRKLLFTVHNSLWPMGMEELPLRTRIKNRMKQAWLKPVDNAVFTSHECARQINQITQQDFPEYVGKPQQKSIITQRHRDLSRPLETLVYLGRIETNKGVFELLEAFEQLAEHSPDLKLIYAGDGSAFEALGEKVARSKYKKRIQLPGRLNAQEVHHLLGQKADALICPTTTDFCEGLAFVCFEAAAHGVPTIMTSVVPASDLLGDACLVCAPDSANAIAQAVQELLGDGEKLKAMRKRALTKSAITYDRSGSWGSQLFKAICEPSYKQ